MSGVTTSISNQEPKTFDEAGFEELQFEQIGEMVNFNNDELIGFSRYDSGLFRKNLISFIVNEVLYEQRKHR